MTTSGRTDATARIYSPAEIRVLKASGIKGHLEAGHPLIPLRKYKAPAVEGWQHTEFNPNLTIDDFPNNYGVVVPPNAVVIDADPRSYPPGRDCLSEFLVETKLDIKTTYIVKTGSGGYHIWLANPDQKRFASNLTKLGFPGIELKSQGHQVVGPGSIHENRRPYLVKNGHPAKLAQIGAALDPYVRTISEVGTYYNADDDPSAKSRYYDFLTLSTPAVQGQQGDHTTLMAARRGRDLGFSSDLVLEMMLEHYNPRCSPPWAPEDLEKKVCNAYQYAKKQQGWENPEDFFIGAGLGKQDTFSGPEQSDAEVAFSNFTWDTRKDGSYRSTLPNAVNMLSIPNYRSYENVLYNLVRLNQFSSKVEIATAAPWHTGAEIDKHWTDKDTTHLKHLLADRRFASFSTQTIDEAITVVATRNGYHPVRDYLHSLNWDGKPRLDRLFPEYMGSPDGEYVRAVGRTFMIGLVARVMRPGCKLDTMPILEGPQGVGKSTFCSIIGGQWYTDIHLDPSNKDTIEYMLGKLVIEISEFVANTVRDVNSLKSFTTRATDRYRPPYGRTAIDVPRQNCFIVTYNPTASRQYLRDTTGNRRFNPVVVQSLRMSQLKHDRDQLFAEALHRFKQGEPWYITDQRILREAQVVQDARVTIDPWGSYVAEWLAKERKRDPNLCTVPFTHVAELALNLPVRGMDTLSKRRIDDAMAMNKYYPAMVRVMGVGRVPGYRRKGTEKFEGAEHL